MTLNLQILLLNAASVMLYTGSTPFLSHLCAYIQDRAAHFPELAKHISNSNVEIHNLEPMDKCSGVL